MKLSQYELCEIVNMRMNAVSSACKERVRGPFYEAGAECLLKSIAATRQKLCAAEDAVRALLDDGGVL